VVTGLTLRRNDWSLREIRRKRGKKEEKEKKRERK